MAYHLAMDIGASSRRHLLGHVENGHIEIEEVYRFENKPVTKDGQLCRDVEALWHNMLTGMAQCGRLGKLCQSRKLRSVSSIAVSGERFKALPLHSILRSIS